MDHFETFYSTHINKVFTYCKYRVKDYKDAQDLTADTFTKFMKARGLSKPNPVGYLYTICKHTLVDYYRDQHPTTSLDCIVDQLSSNQNTDEETFARLDLLRMVDSLEPVAKEAILLKYVQDLDIKTVSHILQKSESATKSIIYRSLETLRGTYA